MSVNGHKPHASNSGGCLEYIIEAKKILNEQNK